MKRLVRAMIVVTITASVVAQAAPQHQQQHPVDSRRLGLLPRWSQTVTSRTHTSMPGGEEAIFVCFVFANRCVFFFLLLHRHRSHLLPGGDAILFCSAARI